MLVQIMLIDVLHVHLLGGRQAERQALSLWGEETAERASDPRERVLDLMGKVGARPSLFPPPDPSAIPMSAATAPPRRKRGRHREERWWKLPPQREPSESKHTQWQTLTKRAVRSLESWLCVLCSQADHTRTVCIPSSEEHTACNAICSRPASA